MNNPSALLAAFPIVALFHRHHACREVRPGADHIGVIEVCRCEAVRMAGDRRWHRHLPQIRRTDRIFGQS